jgi:hypothetical protein
VNVTDEGWNPDGTGPPTGWGFATTTVVVGWGSAVVVVDRAALVEVEGGADAWW